MEPFDDYPEGGRTILEKKGDSDSRHKEGLWLMENAKQYRCVYCDVSLVDEYYHWLLLNAGWVIPVSQCRQLGIPDEWSHSFTNAVLACYGCKGFDNKYTIDRQQLKAAGGTWTVPEFIALRDKVFTERKARICKRRAQEVQFFEREVKQYDADVVR